MSSTIAASLFPSPTSLALFRPSARSPFSYCRKVMRGCCSPLPAVPLLLVRLLPYGITYRDEKDKRRAENICTSKRSKRGRKRDQKRRGGSGSKLLWGILDRPREGTPTFLPNSHHGADIAVITRLTKVFPHRRCTSVVRRSVRLVPDRLLR